MSSLLQNMSAPYKGFSGGGAYAEPGIHGDTIMNMFGPRLDSLVPHAGLLNPFSNMMQTRREVPDTTSQVNLPEVVIYAIQSDDEEFMLTVVLPLVHWGWATKTFVQQGLMFPQMPIIETAETAPPRFGVFTSFSETTTLGRFSGGIQLSGEFGKTEMGKRHQIYNLVRMKRSIQARLTNDCYAALLNCQKQMAYRNAQMGQSNSTDARDALEMDVKHWAMPIKKKHGFQKLYEDVVRRLKQIDGQVNSAICSRSVNSLMLAKPESIEYYRAGPEGVRIVSDMNRSIFSGKVVVFYTNQHPERVGATLTPLQKVSQIGSYHKSGEMQGIRQNNDKYLQNYNTEIHRTPYIYCQERDAMVPISPFKMLKRCRMFDDQGFIKPINLQDGFAGSDVPSDFLTLPEDENGNFSPPSVADVFAATFGGPRKRGNRNGPGGAGGPSPKGLQVFGQLSIRHFTILDRQETGRMLLHRLNERVPGTSSAIQKGLALYERMCKSAVDLEFIDFVVRANIFSRYSEMHKLDPVGDTEKDSAVAQGRVLSGNRKFGFWVDKNAKDNKTLLEKTFATAVVKVNQGTPGEHPALAYPNASGTGETGDLTLPLGFGNTLKEGKKFSNLTGFASLQGFRAMARALNSDASAAGSLYDVEQLETARQFVEALDLATEHLHALLPTQSGTRSTEDRTAQFIAQRLFNLVGFQVSVNIKKVHDFIISNEKHDAISSQEAEGDTQEARMVNAFSTAALGQFYSPELFSMFSKNIVRRLRRIGTNAKFGQSVQTRAQTAQKIAEELIVVNTTIADRDVKLSDIKRIRMLPLVPKGELPGTFVIFWTPLRLKLYSVILQAANVAHVVIPKDDVAFLEFMFDLMTVANADSAGLQTLLDRDQKGFVTTDGKLPQDDGSNVDLLATRAQLVLTLLGQIKSSDQAVNKHLSEMAKGIQTALKDDRLFFSNNNNFGREDARLAPEILKKIFPERRNEMGFPAGKEKEFLKKAFESLEDVLSDLEILKVSGSNRWGDQLPIGGKFDFSPDKDSLGDQGYYVRTQLVLSSDQLSDLFSKNRGASNVDKFDVRISLPSTPHEILTASEQNNALTRMGQVRDDFAKRSARSKANSLQITNWIDVPYLSVDKRLNNTFHGPWDADRFPNPEFIFGMSSNAMLTENFTTSCYQLDKACPSPWERCLSVLWSCTPFTLTSCEAALYHNVRLPFNFLLFRPHMNYVNEACLFVKPGLESLGFVALAGEDYAQGGTVPTKEWSSNMSYWSAPIIRFPNNCFPVRNFVPCGFGPGGSTGWFSPEDYDPSSLGDFREPQDPGSPSLMCVPVPFTEDVRRDFISTTGRLIQMEVDDRSFTVREEDRRPHFSTWPRLLSNFPGMARTRDSGILDVMGASGLYPTYNTVCWQGMTHYKSATFDSNGSVQGSQFTHMTMNKGPWGPDQGVGCREIYRGGITERLPKFKYNTSKQFTVIG